VACRAIPGSSRGGRPSLAPRSQVDARFDGRGAHQIDYARDVARGSPTIGWAAKNAGSYSTDEQRLGAGCIGGRKHPAALRKEREMSTWRLKSPQPTPGHGQGSAPARSCGEDSRRHSLVFAGAGQRPVLQGPQRDALPRRIHAIDTQEPSGFHGGGCTFSDCSDCRKPCFRPSSVPWGLWRGTRDRRGGRTSPPGRVSD
jgi:hypothetical protein